jgi:hypothetical protein
MKYTALAYKHHYDSLKIVKHMSKWEESVNDIIIDENENPLMKSSTNVEFVNLRDVVLSKRKCMD